MFFLTNGIKKQEFVNSISPEFPKPTTSTMTTSPCSKDHPPTVVQQWGPIIVHIVFYF